LTSTSRDSILRSEPYALRRGFTPDTAGILLEDRTVFVRRSETSVSWTTKTDPRVTRVNRGVAQRVADAMSGPRKCLAIFEARCFVRAAGGVACAVGMSARARKGASVDDEVLLANWTAVEPALEDLARSGGVAGLRGE
jgi:hypothetical protein